MHRRFVKSLASVMGAAALVIAPAALLAPAAQADHVLTPDDFAAGTNENNQPEAWEAFLEAEGYTNVACVKDDSPETPYLLEDDYLLAVVKSGSGDEANELYWDVEAGHYLEHSGTGDNSHIILCTGDKPDTSTPTPSKTTPTKTGPVVETDRVSDSGSTTALGVIAGGALIAGAGALFLSRRREGAHR